MALAAAFLFIDLGLLRVSKNSSTVLLFWRQKNCRPGASSGIPEPYCRDLCNIGFALQDVLCIAIKTIILQWLMMLLEHAGAACGGRPCMYAH